MDLKNYKGVLHGDQVQELFEIAKKHQLALPAVEVKGTNSINAVKETAKAVNFSETIPLSHSGAQFYGSNSLDNSKLRTCALGAIKTGAPIVRSLWRILGEHVSHCAKELLLPVNGWLNSARNSLLNDVNFKYEPALSGLNLITIFDQAESPQKRKLKREDTSGKNNFQNHPERTKYAKWIFMNVAICFLIELCIMLVYAFNKSTVPQPICILLGIIAIQAFRPVIIIIKFYFRT